MTVNVLHEGTWSTAPICYLEDLFVAPEARGGGIGRALIADLVERGKARGWSRLYWHTRAGNAQARQLYERFVAADDFCRYRLVL
jgi:GNAT superfamily N-acetyltransferase